MKHELRHAISQTLSEVVSGICYHPEDLDVIEKDHGPALEIRFLPHMADLRIIIGKGGRQARALRYVGTCMGAHKNKSVDVQFEESYVGNRDEISEFSFDPDYGINSILEPVQRVCDMAFSRAIAIKSSIRDGKFKLLLDVKAEEVPLVSAIADMFYPYGRTHGRLVEIKAMGFCYDGQPR